MTFRGSLEEIVRRNENGLLGLHQSWSRVQLCEVASILNGFAFPSARFNDDGRGVPLLRIRDVLKHGIETFYDGAFDDGYLVEPGGLVIGMDGDFNCALWRGPRAVLNQRVCKVTPDERFYSRKFLAYCLPGFLSAINAETSSITVKHLSSRTVGEIPLPLPPLPEQHRIVAEIEKHFTRLDAAVSALKRVRANLKRYRASVLKAACEGRLVPTEAELAQAEGRDYEPADVLLRRILKERRARWEADELAKMQAKGKPPKDDRWKAKYKEPEPPDTSDLPELPEGWVTASTDQLTIRITSGSRDWSKYYGRGSGTFLMAQNVRPAKLDLSLRQAVDPPIDDRERARSQVLPGDLLVTIVGANTGDVCRVPRELPEHYVCQSVALMRPVYPGLSAFLEIYLVSEGHGQRQYQRFIYGQGRPHLSFDQLKVTTFMLPPSAEQPRIVEEVERRLSVIDGLEAQIEANLKRAEHLRQAILKRAFEGKLVPQDPDDEPASVLLERIRAERETAAAKSNGRRGRTATNGKRKEKLGGTRPLFEVGEPV